MLHVIDEDMCAFDCSGGWVFFPFKEKFVFYIHLKNKEEFFSCSTSKNDSQFCT